METVGGFALKGSFRQKQLDGAENENLYYLKDNEFYHANNKINIAPFRAYIEGMGGFPAKSLMLIAEDDEETTVIPGLMDADGNIDETEASNKDFTQSTRVPAQKKMWTDFGSGRYSQTGRMVRPSRRELAKIRATALTSFSWIYMPDAL